MHLAPSMQAGKGPCCQFGSQPKPPACVRAGHDAGGAVPQRQRICTECGTVGDAHNQSAQEALADANLQHNKRQRWG